MAALALTRMSISMTLRTRALTRPSQTEHGTTAASPPPATRTSPPSRAVERSRFSQWLASFGLGELQNPLLTRARGPRTSRGRQLVSDALGDKDHRIAQRNPDNLTVDCSDSSARALEPTRDHGYRHFRSSPPAPAASTRPRRRIASGAGPARTLGPFVAVRGPAAGRDAGRGASGPEPAARGARAVLLCSGALPAGGGGQADLAGSGVLPPGAGRARPPHRGRSRQPPPHPRPRRPALHDLQVPHDAGRRRARRAAPSGAQDRTPASPRWAGCCASTGWTSCPSCSTCSGAR